MRPTRLELVTLGYTQTSMNYEEMKTCHVVRNSLLAIRIGGIDKAIAIVVDAVGTFLAALFFSTRAAVISVTVARSRRRASVFHT